jgi:hypothetical protein
MSDEFNQMIDDHREDEKPVTKEIDTQTFERRLASFLKKSPVTLYILTPCFGGMCHVNYIVSLMSTKELLEKVGIKLKIEFCKNDSLVSRARNNLVAKAMADPDTTHIIFIDNDITWSPAEILKLLISEKSLVGGVYPLKTYFWDRLTNENAVKNLLDKKNAGQFRDRISNADFIQQNLLNYNINYIGTELKIENNLANVRHLATGFMMFKRSTIETLFKAFPSTKYTDDVGFLSGNQNDFAYALFDCGVEDGHYLSEDWLFCHRWAKLGGKIWIDVSISLTHTGSEDYKGCYIASVL